MKINKELTRPILDWCLKKENRDKYFRNPGSHYGTVKGQTNLECVDLAMLINGFPYDSIFKIEKELLINYGFERFYRDMQFGIMISYSESGHVVHEHTDYNFREEDIHTRINLMISKPYKGGLAIINNKTIDVEENEPWLCLAGHYKHSSTKVEGNKPRLILSFGYQVNKKELKNKKWL